MNIEPYLNFDGRCDEAIEFYKSAIGAKVNMLMRFRENPDPSYKPAPEVADKVMHASLRIGDSVVMASDGRCQGKGHFAGISLSITTANDAEAQQVFSALGEGGKVTMPLTKTFFSSSFGMVTDRFGLSWMILVRH